MLQMNKETESELCAINTQQELQKLWQVAVLRCSQPVHGDVVFAGSGNVISGFAADFLFAAGLRHQHLLLQKHRKIDPPAEGYTVALLDLHTYNNLSGSHSQSHESVEIVMPAASSTIRSAGDQPV